MKKKPEMIPIREWLASLTPPIGPKSAQHYLPRLKSARMIWGRWMVAKNEHDPRFWTWKKKEE